MAPQLTATKGPSHLFGSNRWMAWARTCFPVPVSPVIKIGRSLNPLTRSIQRKMEIIAVAFSYDPQIPHSNLDFLLVRPPGLVLHGATVQADG